jgi:hypothetical protein
VDVFQWLAESLPAGAIVNGLGLGALAILFAGDRILTRGQHERRVADIVKGHDAVLAEKATQLADMRESRNYYRDARLEERGRADEVTGKLAELAQENGQLVAQLLEAVKKAGTR